MRSTISIAIVVVFTLLGCDGVSPGMCSDEYVYGVQAEISHPGGIPLEQWAGSVRLTSANYEEELDLLATPDDGEFVAFGAGERPGNYTLIVEAAECRTWESENIVVTEGECHVNQVKVTVDLQLE